jgi:hypothetical protein
MDRLVDYFNGTQGSKTLETVGAEIETQFVDSNGKAIATETSQKMLKFLSENGWAINGNKSDLITSLIDKNGNQMFYELGRHNVELSTVASRPDGVLQTVGDCLVQLYEAAYRFSAKPYFEPVLESDEDLLVIPDERDAIWLELDGRSALADLARTSSVQFTFSVDPMEAIDIVNRLGEQISTFLEDYPQDKIWKGYIANSHANYLSNRYGGPTFFESVEDYCQKLTQHDFVAGTKLVPYNEIDNVDISLYLRSIWWHFRLKRYDDTLCVETRPMPRRSDNHIKAQYQKVLEIVS